MNIARHELQINCRGRGCYNITHDVSAWLATTGVRDGLLNLFVRHTSCSLMVQENADPDVLEDMERFLSRLVPDGDPAFLHRSEGADDMPAHIRMALTQVSLTLPIASGRLALGVWQGVYLYEHRYEPMLRRVWLQAIGQ